MLQFLITMIACAINERMQRKLDYSQEEVRVLKDMLKAVLYGKSSRELSQDCGRMRRFDWCRAHREARPKCGLLARFPVRHRTVLASTV